MSKKTIATIVAGLMLAFLACVTHAQSQPAASAATATAAPTLTPAEAIDVHEDMVAKCLAVKREVAAIATGRSKIGDLAVADRQSAKDALDKRVRDAARIMRELKCGSSGSGQKPTPQASSGQKPDNAVTALLLAHANADLVVQVSALRATAALAAASAVTPASQQQQGQKPVPAAVLVVERVGQVGRVRHREIVVPELCIAHFAGGTFTDSRPVGWAIRNTPEECDTWELMLRSQHSLPPSGK